MKLPYDTIIAPKKLHNYLLIFRTKDDKSKWLASAGYISENWAILEQDLRKLLSEIDAIPLEQTRFGQMYEIRGNLIGPNGRWISVQSYWMTEWETGLTKFVTMFPDKELKNEL